MKCRGANIKCLAYPSILPYNQQYTMCLMFDARFDHEFGLVHRFTMMEPLRLYEIRILNSQQWFDLNF